MFPAWESFYVIVGSSAAALTGLQFVVITVGAERAGEIMRPEAQSAFGTPTVIHFCAVLVISALVSMPWHTLISPAICLAIAAVVGLALMRSIYRGILAQNTYKPVFEDWLTHVWLPAIAYAALLLSSILLPFRPHEASFLLAFTSLLLLLTAIHNAWDSVVFLTTRRTAQKPDEKKNT